MTTLNKLRTFAAHVAENDTHQKILAAEAKLLLGLPIPEFDPQMVLDCIRDARFAESEGDMQSELRIDLEALCLLYGDKPINYIVDRIEAEGVPEEWDNTVLYDLGYIDHESTKNRRRLILEKVAVETTSPRERYMVMMQLLHIKDVRSIPVIEWIIDHPIYKLVDSTAVQVLEQFKKIAAKQ